MHWYFRCLYQRQIDFGSLRCICIDTLLRKEIKLLVNQQKKKGVFMLNKLLDLRPRQYLCPLCGTWHQWNNPDSLRDSWNGYSKVIFNNTSIPNGCADGRYSISVCNHVDASGDKWGRVYDLKYACQSDLCIFFVLCGKVSIGDFKEHSDKPIVTVDVPLVLKSEWQNIKTTCKQCRRFKNCNFYKQYIAACIAGDFTHPEVQLGFEFDPSEYEEFSEAGQKRRAYALKKKEYALNHLEEFERTLNDKEQALEERERALKEREQALQKQKDEFKDHEQSG